jgi:hypothetical protein
MKKIEEIAKKLKAYQASYILTNGATKEIIADFDQSLENLYSLKKDKLKEAEKKVYAAYNEMKELYGIVADDDTLIKYAASAFLADDGKFIMLPKYFIEKLFTNYEYVFSSFKYLSEHSLIAIDPGLKREKQGEFEVFEIEATFFEDMCALYNEYKNTDYIDNNKTNNKKKDSLMRAILISSFNFLESYLNGIAFDYYIKNKEKITKKEKEKLTETKDDGSNRYLSLREKIISYPRIIISDKHPVFDEDNCKEVKNIVNIAKKYRDAIVHSSPYVYDLENTPEKIALLYSLDENIIYTLVNDTIALVKKIDNKIYPDHTRIGWIQEIGEDGTFNDSVFY